jgi:hypothetical protein
LIAPVLSSIFNRRLFSLFTQERVR